MKTCNLKLRGLSALDEGFILAMLSLNAQLRLNPAWRVVGAEAPQAVIYDLGDAESFVDWSRAQQDRVPVPVALAEQQPIDAGWFLQKPLRADQLIEVLNGIAAQLGSISTTSAPVIATGVAPTKQAESPLLHRLTTVVERRQALGHMKRDIKLIFAGTTGAGKSTAIGAISDIRPIRTEARATDEVARKKELTTVAMDYGEMMLGADRRVRLYGAPGQGRYDFMSRVLSQGALGLILLIDNVSVDPFPELDYYLDLFTDLIRESALVVGVTHMDLSADPPLERYRDHLRNRGFSAPVHAVDARNKSDVLMLIEELVNRLEAAA
ncbi:MAG: hypothetical protein KF814_09105 [Nitrospiraceae bacterium]|nr:hypothetical protein [Nitrospiraceae bacterium]